MNKPMLAIALTALGGTAAADALLPDGTRIGTPVSHAKLTVLPLIGAAAGGEDYLVLDEGMDRGLVKIVERGGGGSVNRLVLDNRSDRPLFVMSGEVILGGQQDRIIGKDTVIPPRKRKEVDVFCVEHGRWSGGDKSFRTAKAMAHTKLRKQASYGSQGQVWDEVASKNRARGTANATDTYRRVATEESGSKDVRGYEEAIGAALARMPDADRVVGVAVAVNGEVVALEQFASPRLFTKIRSKLLRSYFVEALDVPAVKVEKQPGPAEVVAFARQEETAAAATVIEEEKRKTEQLTGRGFKGTKVTDDSDAQAPAKPVYKSLHKD